MPEKDKQKFSPVMVSDAGCRRPTPSKKEITITVTFNQSQAWLYAQFLKRVTFYDYRERAMNDDETYIMIDAGELIRDALRDKGFAPR